MASVNGGTCVRGGFYGDFLPLASLLEASSISADDHSASIPGITSQCRLRVKGFAHRLGVDVNESMVYSQTCDSLHLYLGTPWLPGHWGSREEFSGRFDQLEAWYACPNLVPDTHRGNEIEDLLQWHRDTKIENGCLVTIRKESAPLYCIALNGSRQDGEDRISGIIAKHWSLRSLMAPFLRGLGTGTTMYASTLKHPVWMLRCCNSTRSRGYSTSSDKTRRSGSYCKVGVLMRETKTRADLVECLKTTLEAQVRRHSGLTVWRLCLTTPASSSIFFIPYG